MSDAPTFIQTPAQAADPGTPAAAPNVPVAQPAAPVAPATTLTEGAPAAPADPAAPAAVDPNKPADPPKVEAPAFKPEDYKVNLPEGLTQGPALDALTAAAVEKGVSPETVQAIIDKVGPEIAKQLSAPMDLWKQTNEAWTAEVKADPDIGGDKLAATVTRVRSVLATYGAPGINDALNATGAGNNPAIIRTLNNMAKALTEGGAVTGGAPTAPRNAAALLYPSHAAAG